MQESYPTFHALLHDAYTEGEKLALYAPMLEWSARLMLDKTTILQALPRAKALSHLLKSYRFGPSPSNEDFQRHHELAKLAADCLSPIVDDVLLISAFEIHAKATLLRKRYVVHEVKSPEEIAKRQRREPIHVRTVKASQSGPSPIQFKETTLSLGALLEPRYRKYFPMSVAAGAGLKEVRSRRNLVHFNAGYSWKLSLDLISFVEHLDKLLPKKPPRRR